MKRDGAACLFLVAFFMAWHAAGVFGGQVYFAEDTAAYFFSNRSVHYALGATGDFSFWDPLPGLGLPRLANIQNGSFAPLSLLFYAIPPATVFGFYPALVLSLLSLATFALFRAKGVSAWPALFGALSWSTLGAVTSHVEHTAVIETLLFLPVTLLGWELAVRRKQGRWAVLAGVALAFQCFGASPQYLVYNGLVMALWIGQDLFSVRRHRNLLRERAVFLAGIVGIGLGLGSWQLLPFLEMVQESHRALLHDPEFFSGLYRAAPDEVLLALAAEVFATIEAPVLEYGAPYRNRPQLSAVALVLAVFALWRKPRPWAPAIGAGLFLLGMLGAEGGVTPLLREVVPFVDRLRAPYRMIVPAGFLVSWLAAIGLQRLLDSHLAWRRPLAALCVAWVAIVGWGLKRPLDRYVDGSTYNVPEAVARAEGRVVVDFLRSPGLPLFATNAGLAAGVPTLLMREVLVPANFFEAYFASQYGSLQQEELHDRVIVAASLPLENPDAPIWRAFGLRTVVRLRNGRFESELRPDALPRFYLVPAGIVEAEPEGLWARVASPAWDPAAQVLLRAPVPGVSETVRDAPAARIRVLSDEKAQQSLEVDSDGGVLVTSELFFPGWSVEIDGRPAEALEVNLALRGVALPPGPHRVDWEYTPTWLPGALLGTLLALGCAIGLVLFAPRRSAGA